LEENVGPNARVWIHQAIWDQGESKAFVSQRDDDGWETWRMMGLGRRNWWMCLD